MPTERGANSHHTQPAADPPTAQEMEGRSLLFCFSIQLLNNILNHCYYTHNFFVTGESKTPYETQKLGSGKAY